MLILFQLKHVDLDGTSSTRAPSQTSHRGSASRTRSSGLGSMSSQAVISTGSLSTSVSPVQDPAAKIFELSRKLVFVKTEHAAILKGLHAEIEDLKRKNKGEESFYLKKVLHERLKGRQKIYKQASWYILNGPEQNNWTCSRFLSLALTWHFVSTAPLFEIGDVFACIKK